MSKQEPKLFKYSDTENRKYMFTDVIPFNVLKISVNIVNNGTAVDMPMTPEMARAFGEELIRIAGEVEGGE